MRFLSFSKLLLKKTDALRVELTATTLITCMKRRGGEGVREREREGWGWEGVKERGRGGER